jgi:hypothetical protein
MHPKRTLSWSVLAVLALLLASPLAAYTVYLKNGTTIQAKGKYQIRNGKAYILLANGTQSFIAASEIDIRKTDEANTSDYGGNAVILDQGNRNAQGQPAPPPRQKKLSDLIASRTTPRELPGARRETPPPADAARVVKTRAGYADLALMARRPYPQTDMLTEMQQFFHSQSIDDVEVYSGTRADRPLVEITTASEGSVFRALSIAANALLHTRDRFPDKIAGFDLLLTTPSRERAGQFVLTPEMAADLVAKKIELTAFYVQNVQF